MAAPRLAVLLRHLPQGTAPALRPPLVRPAAEESCARTPPPLKQLTKAQIEEFARMGYLVLPIDELDPQVHARIYEHARINQKGGVFTEAQRGADADAPGSSAAQELTSAQKRSFRDDFDTVAQSPTILGAMHSLLGPDFVGYVDSLQGGRKERADLLGVDKSNRTRGAVNDRSAVDDVPTLPNALVATTGDNQHHKDGTSLPVREHRFRAVGYWYYCCDVTVEMGPTCVVPASQYWAVDRDTFPHSEERLDLALRSPKSLQQWRDALMAWNGFALSMHAQFPLDPATGRPASGEVSAKDRDARIAAGLSMLGDPEHALDYKLTVPAGSVVIKHNDLWHRVSRSGSDGRTNDGVPWRPMFSGTFSRGSEPTTAQGRLVGSLSSQASGFRTGEVWCAALDWLSGGRSSVSSVAVDLNTALKNLRSSSSERDRVTAATQIGVACRASDSSSTVAAKALLNDLASTTESIQRSAAYGLSVAGPTVVLPLAEQIEQLLDRDRVWLQDTAPDAMALDTGIGAGYTWHMLVNATFALGESVETATSELLQTLDHVLEQGTKGITQYLASMSPGALAEAEAGGRTRGFYLCTHQVDFYVTQRRRAMACALNAVGFVGHRAVMADDSKLATVALKMLLPHTRGEVEIGASMPSHNPPTMLGSAAARAVLFLVSVTTSNPSLLNSHGGGSLVDEAKRRLAWALRTGAANSAQRALMPVFHEEPVNKNIC